jgi:molecular chaperone HscC
MFGRFPTHSINPDEAVAIGAAIQAGLKARDLGLSEVVLTDVCPYTLGTEVREHTLQGGFRDGAYLPIIERNTVIPASRMQTLSTVTHNQRHIECSIYQGESRKAADNILLGRIQIDIPPRPAGQINVDLRFTYDINGLLEVDLSVPTTGEKRQLIIFDDESRVAGSELAARRAELEKLKIHPRDTAETKALLTRAHRCYEQHLGEQRARISQLIGEFEAMLDKQDPRGVTLASEQLSRQLDHIEGERYL